MLMISLGAIPGALIRWHVNNDFLLNILGTFLLGLVLGMKLRIQLQFLIGIGFCGALTTFSSWLVDSSVLFLSGNYVQAILLIIFPLLLGLLSAFWGLVIGFKIKSFNFASNHIFSKKNS